MSVREFVTGLRPSSLLGTRPRAPMMTACLYLRWAPPWIFWRGIYWPLADEWNVIAWRHGWGKDRWQVRIGDPILVHGHFAVVCAVNFRTGEIYTDDGGAMVAVTGMHSLTECCEPYVGWL